ncbi:Transient receptor putative cation channel subfamily M member 2 [Mactra antiquata]
MGRKYKNERELVQWENVIADSFHQKSELKDTESMDYKVNTTYNLLSDMTVKLEELQDHQSSTVPTVDRTIHQTPVQPLPAPVPLSPSSVTVHMPPSLESRLNRLETDLHKHMEATFTSLNWIMTALKEGKEARHREAPFTQFSVEEKRRKEKKKKDAKQKELHRKVFEMLQKGIELHFRARTTPYLSSNVERFPVPDDKVDWNAEYTGYSPPFYTAPSVLSKPAWADPDLTNMSPTERLTAISCFNNQDIVYKTNRVSYCGTYNVVDGLPINPKGRTGLQGRGLLGRWGPNHAGDPVVTRWKTENGVQCMKDDKPVLEFVAVLRSDNQMWALPGAILQTGTSVGDSLKAEFTEEAIGDLAHILDEKTVKKKLKKLWKNGVKVYEGYADDPRNTDNAWLETVAFSYHDNEGTILDKLNLRAGETVDLATWITASRKVNMHGSHLYILKLACDRLGAYF